MHARPTSDMRSPSVDVRNPSADAATADVWIHATEMSNPSHPIATAETCAFPQQDAS